MMNLRFYILCVALLLSVTASAAPDATQEPVEVVPSGSVTVDQPWIRTGGEDEVMLPGYVILKSDANTPWSLDKVTARGFAMVMIHRVVLQDGETRMALQDSLTIPPGETIAMNDKGFHLMFMGPRKEYKDGDKISVVLTFRDQKPVKMLFPVLKQAPATALKK